eukprot:GEMP01004607.1.p1 GENE.GEMP01004607.1~~GEMP01004607.1.p1  ORF type:complete len:814 (+),score=131.44 GEMP01004607.1:30-2471(+)
MVPSPREEDRRCESRHFPLVYEPDHAARTCARADFTTSDPSLPVVDSGRQPPFDDSAIGAAGFGSSFLAGVERPDLDFLNFVTERPNLDFLNLGTERPNLDFLNLGSERPNLDFLSLSTERHAYGNSLVVGPESRAYGRHAYETKDYAELRGYERHEYDMDSVDYRTFVESESNKYRTLVDADKSPFGVRTPLERDSSFGVSLLMDDQSNNPTDGVRTSGQFGEDRPFVNAFGTDDDHLGEGFLDATDMPNIPIFYDQAAQMELPAWQDEDEKNEHRYYMWRFHCQPCTLFTQGHCPRHKPIMKCFNFHFETQRRRPLVDGVTWQLNYWDAPCPDAMHGPCPRGDYCFFAHNRDEISYHAAKYKTKLCNEKDCRGEHICCFAHGMHELRNDAATKYSYFTRLKEATIPRQGEGLSALYHPDVYKHRFCASFPNVSLCKRGDQCAFAHSRNEIRTPLLSEEEELHGAAKMTDHFFMYKFKTLWCPVGVQHDWQTCVYAHNYQDARRHPSIGYGPRPCPFWNRKQTDAGYAQRCPNGVRCPYAHGAKEQLYHPAYFRTVPCQEKMHCPRAMHCVFWHSKSQRRKPQMKDEDFDYDVALGEECLKFLQDDFTTPLYQAFLGIGGQNEFPLSEGLTLEDPSDVYAEEIEASIVRMERQLEKQQAEKNARGFGSPQRVPRNVGILDFPSLADESLLRKQADMERQWEESHSFLENGTNSLRADAPVFHPIFSAEDETPTADEKDQALSMAVLTSDLGEEDLTNEEWNVRQSLEFLWTDDPKDQEKESGDDSKSPRNMAPQRLYRCFSSPPIMAFHAIW